MHGFLGTNGFPGDLANAVRDDLVGIHVRAGAGAGLVNVKHEMRVELACGNFKRGLLDESGFVPSEYAKLRVRFRDSPFDEAVGVDDRVGDGPTADGKV